MGNILTYINEYGALSFEERPFCEVDSLVLAQLSYLDFRATSAQGRGETLLRLAPEFSERFVRETRVPKENTELFFSAAASERFGACRILRHVSVLDLALEKQFSATCFETPGALCVVYRGTDDTFVGWKEDLNLSFMPQGVPAQVDALAYLEAAAAETDKPLIVSGHSKGGNLAAYSAVHASPETQARITAVYDHDGPGFLAEVFRSEGYLRIKDRLRKTMPQTAIVGMMLEEHGDFTIIRSDAFGILQHDPFNWVVEEGKFVPVGSMDGFAKYTDRIVGAWLASMDMETRRGFVDGLYSVLEGTDAVTFADFRENRGKVLSRAVENIRSADPNVRKMVTQTLAGLLRFSVEEAKEQVMEKLEEKLPVPRSAD